MSAGDDELAHALRRRGELELELADARQDVRWLEHELAKTEAKSAQLDSDLSALRTEREELLIQVTELNERLRQLSRARIDATRHEPTPLGNRATRRQAARQRRR